MEISAASLLEYTQAVSKFTVSTGLLPVYRNAVFVGPTVMAYNGVAGIILTIQEDFGDIPFTINAAHLLQMLKKVKSDATIKLDVTKTSVVIKAGAFQATFQQIPCDDLLNLVERLPEGFDNEYRFSKGNAQLSASAFDAMDKILFCAPSDGTLLYLEGVEITEKYLYVTDTRRVSRISYEDPGYVGFMPSLLCSTCMTSGKKNGAVVSETENLVVVDSGNILVFSAKPTGKCPDFEVAFKKLAAQKKAAILLGVDPDALREAVGRVALFSSGEFGCFVRLDVSESEVTLTSIDVVHAKEAMATEPVELLLPCEHKVSVVLHANYLIDALAAFDVVSIVPEAGQSVEESVWGVLFKSETHTHFCPSVRGV